VITQQLLLHYGSLSFQSQQYRYFTPSRENIFQTDLNHNSLNSIQTIPAVTER
jgi:hypothetical protein